ncbi:hypothetical protein XELAEV_18000183mg [Xenopus laevis]|uniref:Uncharacterized protein n=1 Tax=Xenopus laevis TaxID=8355 RepID=A0A974BQE4_XENLA|nr:hypothetical protein XELAEV_18000183mg [Xenopus laevis]
MEKVKVYCCSLRFLILDQVTEREYFEIKVNKTSKQQSENNKTTKLQSENNNQRTTKITIREQQNKIGKLQNSKMWKSICKCFCFRKKKRVKTNKESVVVSDEELET